MAIDLLNSFLQRKQNVTSNQKGTATQTTGTSRPLPQNLQVMRAIKALQAGQTIQGEVVCVNGKEVQIAILNDLVIDARLAQSMNLTPGVTMPFQVKANNSQGLSLIPLFTNIAADPNVLKALDMAQVPVNDRSLEMVQTLMEKGMPIDKNSLQEMYREVANFKEVPVKDIVSLHQLEVPVNRENLNQLSLYQNHQHCLKDTFIHMGKEIGSQIESLIAEGKEEAVFRILNQLQELFHTKQETTQEKDFRGNIMTDQSQEPALLLPEEKHSLSENVAKATVIISEEMLLQEDKNQSAAKTPLETEKQMKTDASFHGLEKEAPISHEGTQKELLLKNNTDGENSNWKQLEEILVKEKVPGKITQFFEKVWKQEIDNHWILDPAIVSDKKKMTTYYEKLTGQMKQLEHILEENLSLKNPAVKVIQNTVSNLDFMNQLNQMHAYIQLPLKLAEQNAHGELYVFTNKKNFSKQEGKVTALLHLDMENLGKMDVFVALENKKVNTNFYLEKEEYLDFLESHMDLLTARLNQRGYTCEMKTALRNSQEDSMIKIMEKQQETPMLLSMQAFDVRA